MAAGAADAAATPVGPAVVVVVVRQRGCRAALARFRRRTL